VISLGLGVVVGAGASILATPRYGLLLGWMAAAALFTTWMWVIIWPMDADQTADHATVEDAGRAATDVVVVLAAVASLGAVALLLMGSSGAHKDLDAGLGVLSVALAWGTLHTVSTTRYARLYYSSEPEGIDFNETDPPKFSDFAYLAFTIGMTFQVSDTDLKTKAVRAAALRHALLSYLFGAVIIATTINLIAGLGK
jgi:uncharacterized membrane protein